MPLFTIYIVDCKIQHGNEKNAEQHTPSGYTVHTQAHKLLVPIKSTSPWSMQALREHLVHHHEAALLVPLVDLVQEGLQYGLNSFVWLGLDVSHQLVVALPLIFMEHHLDIFQLQKGVNKADYVCKIVVKGHARSLDIVSKTWNKIGVVMCSAPGTLTLAFAGSVEGSNHFG
jgi:hypothetical protein